MLRSLVGGVLTVWFAVGAAAAEPTPAPAALPPLFVDATAEAGLDFVHFNGMSGELYMVEMTGGGGALFDLDGDGDLDLYAVQGALLGAGKSLSDATFPPPGGTPPIDRLFRNDLTVGADGRRHPRFVDVTAASGIRAAGYGMGAATGDVDNDGDVDLYVTHYGSNLLLRNDGGGKLRDVTAASGSDDPRWSTSATFFDYDRDGRLDLFVAAYLDAPLERNVVCYAGSSRRDYCGPTAYPPLADRLFHNRGDGTFEDVSIPSGIARQAGAGLGVVADDLDGDGWVDLYVTNDGMANFLWLNQHDGTFRDEALLAGVAVNLEGAAEASMGVDAGDFDGDGDDDLFMTHLAGETNTLYVNRGGGLFEDGTLASRLGPPSLPYTSFGTAWVDFDRDGRPDLFALNGAVTILESEAQAGDPYPLRQPNQLFHNLDGGHFEEVTARAGSAFAPVEVSRGAAVGDVDEDGDPDLVVFNNSGPARLLLSVAADGGAWIGLRLVGVGGRDMLGARAALLRTGAPPLWRHVHTDGSYCAAGDPRLLFGLAGGPKVAGVRVVWPDGRVETWPAPPAGRYTTLRQGSGRSEGPPP